jgi:6-phosphogluconolactonase
MNNRIVYVGAYTGTESLEGEKAKGITKFNLDPKLGGLMKDGQFPTGVNPTFFVLSVNQQFLYAVNEVTQESGQNGWVSAFAIDRSEKSLTFLNRQSSKGFSPCHLCVLDGDQFLIVANYESGNISLLPLRSDGFLEPACDVFQFRGKGPHQRQKGPHAHMVTTTPDGHLVLAVDLGTDRIWNFEIDQEGGKFLARNPEFTRLPQGSGPRHLDFHPNGRFAYVLGELNSTITLLYYDPDEKSFEYHESWSTLPENFKEQNTGAAIQVSPSGKFVYASNRGHDSIAVFSIDCSDGHLGLVGFQHTQGKTPRHFIIDPSGKMLIAANQDSDSLALFCINKESGLMNFMPPLVPSQTPVCIQFV